MVAVAAAVEAEVAEAAVEAVWMQVAVRVAVTAEVAGASAMAVLAAHRLPCPRHRAARTRRGTRAVDGRDPL